MAKKIVVKIIDKMGLHARPASFLMDVACKYQSDSVIAYDYEETDLKSFSDLMRLNVPYQQVCELIVRGSDEEAAMEEMKEVIVDHKIGEIL